MAMRISPITAQLGRLSLGSATGPITRTSVRLSHTKKKNKVRIEPSFKPGHGEKIFIFSHILEGMTIYGHEPVLKSNQVRHQLPFNGKKLRAVKLRKDYWRPLAMIQFADGQGEVGRSVFQRLRECKKLHAYSWDDTVLYGPNGQTLTTHERGARLNDQRANTIADMAAVLGGLGKGNKIVVKKEEKEEEAAEKSADAAVPAVTDEGKTLFPATVWWTDILDRNYAQKWTKNVSHEIFDEAMLEPTKTGQSTPQIEDEEYGEEEDGDRVIV
ncbi:transcriptional regulation of mitochondrial recombination-domain-containing protein [Xylaria venustula]|nr:transcriptional regulation of mitochondrial recombination-domain-containing protein [Xylaria venustula]